LKTIKPKHYISIAIAATTLSLSAFQEVADGELFVTLDSSIKHDSNIYARTGGSNDNIFKSKPGLQFIRNKGLISLDTNVGVEIGHFLENTNENYEALKSSFTLSFPNEKKSEWTGKLSGGFNQTEEANPDNTTIGRTKTDTVNVDTSVTKSLVSSWKAGVDLGYKNKNELTQGNLDSDEYKVTVSGIYNYSDALDFSVNYAYKNVSFARDTTTGIKRSYNENFFYLGAKGDLLPRLSGEVNAGGQQYDGNGNIRKNMVPFAFARLIYDLTAQTKAELSAGSDYSYTPGADSKRSESVGFKLIRDFNDKWTANAGIKYANEYYGAARNTAGTKRKENDVITYSTGLKYTFVKDLANAFIDVSYEDTDSNDAASKYDRALYELGVNLKY